MEMIAPMSKTTNDSTACVIDTGLFLNVAKRLTKDFERVLFHNPVCEGFPTINQGIIGRGIPGIEKVEDIWSIKDEVDLWVFPDINMSPLQLELESQGRAVWGSRRGDSLELNRPLFHKTIRQLGLEVSKYVSIEGLAKLREHLKNEENKYLKISKYRGSLETFHWRDWVHDEGFLDVLAVRFGPAKEIIPFLVFDAIDTPLEIGADTYCVDGQWPGTMVNGVEIRERGFLGSVTKRDNMPDQIKEVLDAFGRVLGKHRYRNQFSMEVRVLDGRGFFTDPCCRAPMPASSSQLSLWSNFGQIVMDGAIGILTEPEPTAKYAAEVMIKGRGGDDEWTVVELPTELDEHVNFTYYGQNGREFWFPSGICHGDDLGWLVATGDTIEQVIDSLHELVDKLPDGLDVDTSSMVDALKELGDAEATGIEFGEQEIPEPETALK
jgi:hypothetical protein